MEDPFPTPHGTYSEKERKALAIIRRHLLMVVRQLSNAQHQWRENNEISKMDIRPNMTSNQSSKLHIADSPGLLFYYLFDDWYTSYALVAKKEQHYAARLERLVRCPRIQILLL